MAQVREIRLVDDLDGGPAEETIPFSLDGKPYEIDLSETNAANLRSAMSKFVAAARRVGGSARGGARRNGSSPARPAGDREQHQAIREWARKQGMKISDRGRIPAPVMQAYQEEHGPVGR